MSQLNLHVEIFQNRNRLSRLPKKTKTLFVVAVGRYATVQSTSLLLRIHQITMKTGSRFCISAVALVAICLTLLSTPAYAWRRPSLLKQPLHKMMGFGGQEHDTQVASKNDIIIHSPINNAVFCVRGGGGSNGPCIGIDLGKSMCIIL